MKKKDEAKKILEELLVPEKQRNEMCCYTLLALAGMKETDSWAQVTNEWMRIHDVIFFLKNNYNIVCAENSRETIRKEAMHHFRSAAFIEDNGKATNSPNYRYRLTDEMVRLLQAYETPSWKAELENFHANHESLKELYASKKEVKKIPVKINHKDFMFSTGKHNQLQKAILEEFVPRFAPDAECLYVGDTAKKDLFKNTEKLQELGFDITLHDKMPDIVLYSAQKDWLYFIEAVASSGPMSAARVLEIETMTEKVTAGKIYVTAFLDFKLYKRFSEEIAWETEVWLAEMPDHMIHLNGDKFIGQRK